jgi:quercetin dioxygenase-like cupin family protein
MSAAQAQIAAAVIDNDHVTVRDIVLEPGKPGPALDHAGDYAILYPQGGRIRGSDGKVTVRAVDGAFYGHGGTTSDTVLDAPVHEILVDLKDAPSGSVANTSGLPAAFPRPGVKKVFENDRVIVWNYTWLPGKPTPMHFHDKNVVVVYHGDGPLKSVAPDGTTVVNSYKAGEIRFNLANRAHTEELMSGAQSGIMLELK